MWQQATNFILAYLDPVGVIVGLVISIPVLWTWWEVAFGRRRRERRWFRALTRHPGDVAAILIVDLHETLDVTARVERFRQGHEALREIPAERVFQVARNGRLGLDDMPDMHHAIRDAAARVAASGADTLHYFHAGPAAVAALVGAQFANSCRVMLYQYTAGEYADFGPLRGTP